MLITDSKTIKTIFLLSMLQFFTGCGEEESLGDISIIPLEKQVIAEDEVWQKDIELELTDVALDAVDISVISGDQSLIADGDIEFIATESGYQLTITPQANQFGEVELFITANAEDKSANISVSFEITPVNDAPSAVNQSLFVNEDIPIGIILQGADIEGTELTFKMHNQPRHGQLIGEFPELIYTPNENYFGEDSFSYVVKDEGLTSIPAVVQLHIQEVNDSPVAENKNIIVVEETPIAFVLGASDIESTELTYDITSEPHKGALSGSAPNLIYTPYENAFGDDSFTFNVADAQGAVATAVINFEIREQNDAPIAKVQSASTNEDTAIIITLTGTDEEGDALTYLIVTQPSKGQIAGTSPNFTYTPRDNISGTDSFSFIADDTNKQSAPAQVTITINPLNDAPVAYAQALSINENTSLNVQVIATDVERDPLTYSLVEGPKNGRLSGVLPSVVYIPNDNFSGADSFSYLASDNAINSNIADIKINVNSVNVPPVAMDQQVSVNEDVATEITLEALDDDGDILSFNIVTDPIFGTLGELVDNQVTYTPAQNSTENDSFSFKVNDGQVDSEIITVDILLTPFNDEPVAMGQNVGTEEDTSVVISLEASDIEDDVLTYLIESQPTKGSLSEVDGNQITYTPNQDAVGSDSFVFKVNDGQVDSGLVTVTLDITPVNDQPLAQSLLVTVTEDVASEIILLGSDIEGGHLNYLITSSPTQGTLSLLDGNNLTYTPYENATGTDHFSYRVNDGELDSDIADVNIAFNAINDLPVATAQSIDINEDQRKLINLEGIDDDSDTLSFSIVSQPSFGELTALEGNELTYIPTPDSTQNDRFSFKVNDGQADSEVVYVDITVNPLNDKPVVSALNVDVTEDIAKLIQLQGSDVDGDALSFSISEQPTQGRLSVIEGSQLTYTPNENAIGSDQFSFKANDGLLDSDAAIVNLQLIQVNDIPVATAQSISINEDQSKILNLAGYDADGDALNFSIVAQPSFGGLTALEGNQLTYIPTPDSIQNDRFSFKVNDGQADSEVVNVDITVNPVNDKPVANTLAIDVTEDVAKIIQLQGGDVDGDALSFAISEQPTQGRLSVIEGSQLTYTPNENATDSDQFSFKANDGLLDSDVAIVNLQLIPVNDLPEAIAQSITINEDKSKVINLAGVDVDGDALSFSIVSQPSFGELTALEGNQLTYTPTPDSTQNDSFSFKVNDGQLDSEVVNVNITVNPLNDKPVVSALNVDVTEDIAKSIQLQGSDADQDALTFIVATNPSLGTLSVINGDQITYTPNENATGSDSFSYYANDGQQNSDTAVVSIQLSGVNDLPIATPRTVVINEDNSVFIELTGTDVDGDALTFSIVSQTVFGQLSSFQNGGVTYTPNDDSTQHDKFRFSVNDGQGDSEVAFVNITVNAVNDRPIAEPLSYSFNEDEDQPIALKGSDIENSSLQYIVVSQPEKGELRQINGNLFTFTPIENKNGDDEFTYKVNDGELDSDVVTVSLTIKPINDAPEALNTSVLVTEDVDKVIILDAIDVDGDALEYSIISRPGNGFISLDFPRVTYTPASDSNSPDRIIYKVSDGVLESIGRVDISIDPVNDEPIVHSQTITRKAGDEQLITFNASDIDGDELLYQIVTGPSKGIVGTVISNQVSYRADISAIGADHITYRVYDGTTYSINATVKINIIPKVFVDSVSPLSVNANGGDKIYITGRNLASAEVSLNEVDVLNPLVQTDTTIEVIMPAKSAGNYPLNIDDARETIEYSPYINRNTMTLEAGHSCNSVQGGMIKCWGQNSWGQLGNGSYDTWSSRPVQVLNLSGVTAMSSGGEFTCAIDSGQVVWCWGENRDGQLGDVEHLPPYSTIPLRVNTNRKALGISSYFRETCIIDADKDVQCWGGPFPWNEKLPGTDSALKIAVGELHSCIVKEGGSVFCWGPDVDFIGDASRLSAAVDISVGFQHGCALMADKTVWCWGRNEDDQLGTGRAIASQPIPDQVVDITNVIDLDSKHNHSCAVISGGQVYCWGDNRYGQLGSGTAGGSEGRPVSVTGINNAIQVSVGVSHSCALHDDYSMSCWGRNYHGNLGDGNFRVDSTVPVKVLH